MKNESARFNFAMDIKAREDNLLDNDTDSERTLTLKELQLMLVVNYIVLCIFLKGAVKEDIIIVPSL